MKPPSTLPVQQNLTVTGGRLTVRVSGATPESFARLAATEASTTPFQSAGWVRAFLESHGVSDQFRLIELTNGHGSTLLLPVLLTRRAGMTLAEKVGGAHASYFVPGCAGDRSGWPRFVLATALKAAGRLAGIDAYLLADCPRDWDSSGNLLHVLPHRMSPDVGAMLVIDADGETLLSQLQDRDDRKKLRQKRNKLAVLGELQTGWVEPTDIAGVLAVFYQWKATQFAQMGIRDPFAEPAFRRFLDGATAGDDPAIRLYWLRAGERPLAILGGARAGSHFSGMFTAYDPAPEIARHSPGEVLIAALIPALSEADYAGFDLGVGEARYKAHYCPARVNLMDIALPVTPGGHAASMVWRLARKTKRAIKQNGALLGFLKKIRRRLG